MIQTGIATILAVAFATALFAGAGPETRPETRAEQTARFAPQTEIANACRRNPAICR